MYPNTTIMTQYYVQAPTGRKGEAGANRPQVSNVVAVARVFWIRILKNEKKNPYFSASLDPEIDFKRLFYLSFSTNI